MLTVGILPIGNKVLLRNEAMRGKVAAWGVARAQPQPPRPLSRATPLAAEMIAWRE